MSTAAKSARRISAQRSSLQRTCCWRNTLTVSPFACSARTTFVATTSVLPYRMSRFEFILRRRSRRSYTASVRNLPSRQPCVPPADRDARSSSFRLVTVCDEPGSSWELYTPCSERARAPVAAQPSPGLLALALVPRQAAELDAALVEHVERHKVRHVRLERSVGRVEDGIVVHSASLAPLSVVAHVPEIVAQKREDDDSLRHASGR